MSEIKYELPMFSSNLISEPKITIKNMDVEIVIEGYDDEDVFSRISIKFLSVLGMKQTSARFTPNLYGAYDKIVQITESEWLKEMQKLNNEDYSYWKPNHYVMYLDGIGLYQFIAKSVEVMEHE